MHKKSGFSRSVLAIVIAGTVFGFGPAAGELVLVAPGTPPAPIIVVEGALRFTRQAAEDLAEYMDKVSGARPEVIDGRPDPLPDRAIWVGYQPALDALFPDIDFDFQHPEEILIAASDRHLAIAGRDRWDPDHTQVPLRGDMLDGWQLEFGTVNAVYTFLQDYLDVRWLWPGETGEDIIRRERVAFEPFEYRYHPPIRLRCMAFMWSKPHARTGHGGIFSDWSRMQRMQLDSYNALPRRSVFSAHAFSSWWERFHESHPEYFALQPDGTRSGWPSPGRAKLCKSNPAVWEEWLRDVEKILEEDPTRTIFNGAANDGNLSGYCVCENCLAWDAPDAAPRMLVWEGLSQQYLALSDRQTRFANKLARKLRERFPERDEYRVLFHAYGPSRPAPIRTVPDDNVIVSHCTNWFTDMDDRDRRSPGERSAQQYADWAATGARMVYRPNLPGNAGVYNGLPDVPFGRVMATLRHIVDSGCEGVVLGAFWNHWPTQGPLYYMIAQLLWNPDQDGYAVLDDYYRRAFGPAAEPIKAYWTLMEETRNRMVDEEQAFGDAYTPEVFSRAERLLDEAAAVLDGADERYHARIEHARRGLDFTRKMIEARSLLEKHRRTGGADRAATERLRALLQAIRPMLYESDEFVTGRAHPRTRTRMDPEGL